jgi:hypothetical protein
MLNDSYKPHRCAELRKRAKAVFAERTEFWNKTVQLHVVPPFLKGAENFSQQEKLEPRISVSFPTVSFRTEPKVVYYSGGKFPVTCEQSSR